MARQKPPQDPIAALLAVGAGAIAARAADMLIEHLEKAKSRLPPQQVERIASPMAGDMIRTQYGMHPTGRAIKDVEFTIIKPKKRTKNQSQRQRHSDPESPL